MWIVVLIACVLSPVIVAVLRVKFRPTLISDGTRVRIVDQCSEWYTTPEPEPVTDKPKAISQPDAMPSRKLVPPDYYQMGQSCVRAKQKGHI